MKKLPEWLAWLPWLAANKRLVVAVLAPILAIAGIGITVVDDGPAPPAPPSAGQPKQDDAPNSDLNSDLRAETGVSAEDDARNRAIGRAQKPRTSPGARAIMPACRTDYSGRVWSSRNGVRPTEFVLHYTVSPNRPGWADVEAIENYFSSSRVASSHYIMDFEGHCLRMVHGDDKAWTQGNANPWAISVEIIATGRETNRQWRESRLIKGKILARLVRAVMDARGMRLRRVNPSGCVFPSGWTDHNALECGNDHHDVTPNFPYRVFARQLGAVR